MTMIDQLKQDCEYWISHLKEVMRNEREMQVRLAMHLKETKHYDNVFVEYTVPLQLLAEHNFEVPSKSEDDSWNKPHNFPWHNQMYFDVMVEKDGLFAAIELKYATANVKPQPLVFGEEVPNGVEIIKYQGAQNLVMYNYRKDIRRIEALKVFPNVVGGIALIITNDPIYWSLPYSNSGYFAFSTHEGNLVGPGELKWGDNIGDTINGTHPNFVLDSGYNSNWNDVLNPEHNENTNLVGFRYLISVVSKSNDEIGNSVPLKMPNTNLLQIQNTEVNMKYKINVIGKAQNATALGIMHAYLEIFPKSTLADLRRAFPGSIAPDRGVQEIFLPIKDAIKYNSQSDMSLYFTKDNRPTLKLADGSEIAVCQIWTSASLANLVEVAKKYGIKAEVNKEAEIGKFGYNIDYLNGFKLSKGDSFKVIGSAQNSTALGIMHAYLKLNPHATLADLRQVFPNEIAPDRGVKEIFLPANQAEAINKSSDMSLYFCTIQRPPLTLSDGMLVSVCQIWTGKSLANLMKTAERYGIQAEVNKTLGGKKTDCGFVIETI